MPPRGRYLLLLSLLLVAVLPMAACQTPYYVELGMGQATLLAGRTEIDQALQYDHLEPEVAARLRLVEDVRRFAMGTIGLDVTDNYSVWVDNGEGWPVWTVTAAYQDRLQPVVWDFPIIGAAPYRGYFTEARARAFASDLGARGNVDLRVGPVAAWSSLGWFTDPVTRAMLRRDDLDLVQLIMHESLHTTVFRPGDADFNESLATFVERQGTREYLLHRHDTTGLPLEAILAAEQRWADADRFDAFIENLTETLSAYYASAKGMPRASVLAGRERVFAEYQRQYLADRARGTYYGGEHDWFARTRLDNALVLGLVRYRGNQSRYREVLAAVGGWLRDALPVFRAAANAETSPDTYFARWLGTRRSGNHAGISLPDGS